MFDRTRTPGHFGLKILDLARHSLFQTFSSWSRHPCWLFSCWPTSFVSSSGTWTELLWTGCGCRWAVRMSKPHPIFSDRTPCAKLRSRDRCCVCYQADSLPLPLGLHTVHHEGRVFEVCQICDLSACVQELATCGAASSEAVFLVEHRLRELRRLLENDFQIYKQRQLYVNQSRTSAAERGPGEATGCPAVCSCGSELPMGPVPPAPPGPPPC